MEAEVALVALTDTFAKTAEEYEMIELAEAGAREELPAEILESEEFEAAERHMPGDGAFTLGGLDLGVAGVVHALALTRCLTAASCRGHVGPNVWTDAPSVFVVGNRHRATVLQDLVRETNCGLDSDPERNGLLVVRAESVVEMMDLARTSITVRIRPAPAVTPRKFALGAGGDQLSFEI